MPTLLQPPATAHEVRDWVRGGDLSAATELWLLAWGVPLVDRGGAPAWWVAALPRPMRELLALCAENPIRE